MFWISIILYSLIIVPYAILYIRKYKIAPASMWFIMEMMFFYGICLAPKGRTAIAIELESMYVVACIFFIAGLELGKRINTTGLNNSDGSFSDHEPNKNQMLIIWIIIGLSIMLCSYMFIAGGMNVFIQSLRDFFSGENNVYSRQRAQFFGVKGQGYIYQFRVVLLPLLSTFVLIGIRKRVNKAVSISLFILMIIFLLGTGQRNAFVFFCAIVILYVIAVKMYMNELIISRLQIIVLGSFSALFLIILTISNGRVTGDGNIINGAISSIIDRFFFVNQKTAIAAYSYIKTQPTVWGYDWWMMMLDVLPGKTDYLSVDRIVYYLAYGTYSGTGPPCLWASAWYNFGGFGITLLPLIMGVIYHNTYKKMKRTKNKSKLYLLLYVALCVYLGLWTYGTPMTLFNNGVITVLILRWVMFSLIPKLTNQRKQ